MTLIKDSHNTLFHELFDELSTDIGHSITVYSKATGIECTYCFYDVKTGRSSGKQKIAWNTHPNYDNVGLICPNCYGKGRTSTETVTTVNNVIIEDISGVQMKQGKFAWFNDGTRKLMGKLANILTVPSDLNSFTIFDTATRIVIYGEEHRLVRLNRLGLKENYVYEAIVEKTASV